jgi:hypothetical protein
MACPKRDVTGVWACGREFCHPGAHLSADARAQLEVLREKLKSRQFVLTGEALRGNQLRLARCERALLGCEL